MNIPSTQQRETVKYSTQLPPELIKWVKRYALDHDIKDYELILTALEDYKARVGEEDKVMSLFGDSSKS